VHRSLEDMSQGRWLRVLTSSHWRETVSGQSELNFAVLARTTLAQMKYKLIDAEAHVADAPGLYAIYGDVETWTELGLDEPPDARPLYVGKAESSLRERDLKQHFRSGMTGRSTVRRTFAALLRGAYAFRGVPRNKAKPARFSHFALEPAQEAQLTKWMNERLELAVWTKPINCTDLHAVEVEVLGCLVPPGNIQDNQSSTWVKQVRDARRAMAKDAREWAPTS
jgi:hypothetical protein